MNEVSITPYLTKSGANTSDTIVISFIRMLIDGPDVSLNGSPTVSPTTAALCLSDPFPSPLYPASICFLALSHHKLFLNNLQLLQSYLFQIDSINLYEVLYLILYLHLLLLLGLCLNLS